SEQIELVVHAKPNGVVVKAALDRRGADTEGLVAQIRVEILGLGGQARGQHALHTKARSPAGNNVVVLLAAALHADVAEGEASRTVDEVAVEGIAGAPAHR